MRKKLIIAAALISMPLVSASVYAINAPKSKLSKKMSSVSAQVASPDEQRYNTRQTMIQDEVLVSFKKNVAYQQRLTALSRMNVSKRHELSSGNAMTVKIADGESVSAAIARLKSDPAVESVQPNYIYRAFALSTNDAQKAQLWALENTGQTVANASYLENDGSAINNPGTAGKDMNFNGAWSVANGATNSIVVAVLDSGVRYTQEDLSANMWNGSSAGFPNHGYDCVGAGDNDPMDANGHGTHVAGILAAAANNSTGIAGMGFNAKIMAVRVLDATGGGETADIVEGINWAVAHGAKVLNMSLGGPNYDTAMYNALSAARSAGVLVICAAGNESKDIDTSYSVYPAEYDLDNIIVVGAVDQTYAMADFSNTGATKVDIAAPGVNILSTWPGTETQHKSTAVTEWNAVKYTGNGWGKMLDDGDVVFFNPNPFNGSTHKYTSGEDSWIYKNYGSAAQSADVVRIMIPIFFSLSRYDEIRVNYTNGTSPNTFFDTGIITRYFTSTYASVNTGGEIIADEYDITGLAKGNSNCTISFWMKDSTLSTTNLGALVFDPILFTLTYNNTSYNTIDGTSMASPLVAGVAALVNGFNPDYTWQDVRDAIYGGADVEAGLTSSIAGGKVADAYGSLKYIKQPSGVTVE